MSDFIFLCEEHACKPGLCRGWSKCNPNTRAMRRVHDQAVADARKNPVRGYECYHCHVNIVGDPMGVCTSCRQRMDDHEDLY